VLGPVHCCWGFGAEGEVSLRFVFLFLDLRRLLILRTISSHGPRMGLRGLVDGSIFSEVALLQACRRALRVFWVVQPC
jgi:hypothetical protein